MVYDYKKIDDSYLAQTKLSLRLDDDEDDLLVKSLIRTARKDIMGQVGEQIDDFYEANDVFDSAVILEVTHLYNHRDAVSTQQTYEVPMALYSLINSLKDDYRYKLLQKQKSTSEQKENQVMDSSEVTEFCTTLTWLVRKG